MPTDVERDFAAALASMTTLAGSTNADVRLRDERMDNTRGPYRPTPVDLASVDAAQTALIVDLVADGRITRADAVGLLERAHNRQVAAGWFAFWGALVAHAGVHALAAGWPFGLAWAGLAALSSWRANRWWARAWRRAS